MNACHDYWVGFRQVDNWTESFWSYIYNARRQIAETDGVWNNGEVIQKSEKMEKWLEELCNSDLHTFSRMATWHGHPWAWARATVSPWKSCKVFCALAVTVKQLFMHYFHNFSSDSRLKKSTFFRNKRHPQRKSCLYLWICLRLEKILRASPQTKTEWRRIIKHVFDSSAHWAHGK